MDARPAESANWLARESSGVLLTNHNIMTETQQGTGTFQQSEHTVTAGYKHLRVKNNTHCFQKWKCGNETFLMECDLSEEVGTRKANGPSFEI